MMGAWARELAYDPLPKLAQADNLALSYFARRDLMGEEVGPLSTLWQLPAAAKLLGKQEEKGSWRYHGGRESIRSPLNYDQLETYRIFGQLVEKYGVTREHPGAFRAAGFLFSFQTEEGDFRGIYGNQYTPNYSAAIMELLIKAGYSDDPRIARGFNWLLSIRQDDGGWAIPFRTRAGDGARTLDQMLKTAGLLQPDRLKPFSHLITGVVLRAFAAHPDYRGNPEARAAGALLASRFFKPDQYVDRQAAAFWTKIRFPFWFTDIVSAMDSLSLLGFSKDDPGIDAAVTWLIANQSESGLWKSPFKGRDDDEWLTLAICRILKRLL